MQRGLQLCRDITVAKKILEPTFGHTGIRFLLNDLDRLEKCLLSPALDNYPKLLDTLRQLNINVRERKGDFKLLSRSIASFFEELAALSKSSDWLETLEPLTSEHNDIPLAVDDQHVDDLLKLIKIKQRPVTTKRFKNICRSNRI